MLSRKVSKMHPHSATLAVVTYGASATSAVLWGLQISDIGVIVSSAAAVIGVLLQAYVVFRRRRN